ncbi:arylesterase [Comamonadaceae bacterium OH2545_COT-014]|nr:arylesterase [Comamonadaceae bacterium OH2545_COT-014]
MAPALLSACRRPAAAQPVPAGATVLALGDSLTHGTGAPAGSDYPSVLASLTGWRLINAGIPGDTSTQALERLPALLQAHRPALVIVSIGGNDFLRRQPEAATRANLRAICQQALQAGAQVLIVAVPRLSLAAALGQLSDHPLYAETARELKLPLLRDGWSNVLAQPGLRSDAVHANAQGYAQFARHLHATAVAVGLLKG